VLLLFTVHVITLRPYRSLTTNVIYSLAMIGLCVHMIFMCAKVLGYQQSIFVDKYFFTLQLLINGFAWFLVLTALAFTITSRAMWPVTASDVRDLTEGQDYAIFLIKEARKFQIDVLHRKKYSDEDRIKIADILMKMTMVFQKFKDRNPLILDSLLETIDSLRLLQKK
jgi:hypothetical protein